MKQLFIPTGLATESTVATLPAGEAAFMVYDGNEPAIVDDLAYFSSIANDTPFSIIWKKADGTIDTSDPITLNSIYAYDYSEYSAGTAQVTTITPASLASFTQDRGDIYSLKVIKTNPATANLDMFTYQVTNTTGVDFTATTLVTAFKTAINTTNSEASERLGIAATGTTTLILTATDTDNHFSVACFDYFEGSVVVVNPANIPSIGTPAKIAALETECESYHKGIHNKTKFPVKRPDSQVSSSVNYDIATFYAYAVVPGKAGTEARHEEPLKIYIAETTTTDPDAQVAYQIYNRLDTNAAGTTTATAG